jgi:predicted RecB family nuclease
MEIILLDKLSYNRSTENRFGITPIETAYQRMRQIFNYKMEPNSHIYKLNSYNVKEQDKCLSKLGWSENRVRTDLKSCNEVYKFILDEIICPT